MPRTTTKPRGRLLTAEQFLLLPVEGCADLIEGVVHAMGPTASGHGHVELNCGAILRDHVRARGLPFLVATGDVGFVLTRDPDTVRGADVALVRKDRMRTRAERERFVEGPPDLAVEVRSPGDRPGAIAGKIADYLAAGCPLVWDVDPAARTLVVHRAGEPPRTLSEPDLLDARPVLPDLAGTVADLFAE